MLNHDSIHVQKWKYFNVKLAFCVPELWSVCSLLCKFRIYIGVCVCVCVCDDCFSRWVHHLAEPSCLERQNRRKSEQKTLHLSVWQFSSWTVTMSFHGDDFLQVNVPPIHIPCHLQCTYLNSFLSVFLLSKTASRLGPWTSASELSRLCREFWQNDD